MLTTEETAAAFEAYIQSTATTFAARRGEDWEDLCQTGRAALVELYAEHTRPPMPALTRARIRDRMINWIQAEFGTERADDARFGDCPDWEPAGEDDSEAQALANIERARALEGITERQARALQRLIEGDTLQDADHKALIRYRRTRSPLKARA